MQFSKINDLVKSLHTYLKQTDYEKCHMSNNLLNNGSQGWSIRVQKLLH